MAEHEKSSFVILLDENIPKWVETALRRATRGVVLERVGLSSELPAGSTDPEVLRFAEARRALLVTRDRRTMPAHVTDHIAAGAGTWGVLLVRRNETWRHIINDLVIIVDASEPEEWRNVICYLPFEPA